MIGRAAYSGYIQWFHDFVLSCCGNAPAEDGGRSICTYKTARYYTSVLFNRRLGEAPSVLSFEGLARVPCFFLCCFCLGKAPVEYIDIQFDSECVPAGSTGRQHRETPTAVPAYYPFGTLGGILGVIN